VHYSIEKGLRIIGPYDEAGLEFYLLIKRWRDAMFVKMIYDEATFFWRPGARTGTAVAELIIINIDTLMPKRWRLASKQMQEMANELMEAPRQKLTRSLNEAYELLGITLPLKPPMPPAPDKLLRALRIKSM
jgi:hypothetical protein